MVIRIRTDAPPPNTDIIGNNDHTMARKSGSNTTTRQPLLCFLKSKSMYGRIGPRRERESEAWKRLHPVQPINRQQPVAKVCVTYVVTVSLTQHTNSIRLDLAAGKRYVADTVRLARERPAANRSGPLSMIVILNEFGD